MSFTVLLDSETSSPGEMHPSNNKHYVHHGKYLHLCMSVSLIWSPFYLKYQTNIISVYVGNTKKVIWHNVSEARLRYFDLLKTGPSDVHHASQNNNYD